MHNILYFEQVFIDVQEAKIWYKDQKEGLEIEFASAIENAIKQIIKMPTAYSPRYKNVRIAHPKIFPYNIHFYIDEDNKTIVFTAIVHNKRNPSIVKKRV